MIRSTTFYTVQITCCLLLIGLSIWLIPNNLSAEQLDKLGEVTGMYIIVMLFNGFILVKYLLELLPGMRLYESELWTTMFVRNLSSLLSFTVGMIVLGKSFIECGVCDWVLYLVPSVALIADIMNTDEDLTSARGLRMIQNWLRPNRLENRSFWTIMFLYILNLATIVWAFISYYLQNTVEDRSFFEENKYDIVFIVTAAVLCVRMIIFFVGRWYSSLRDFERLSVITQRPISCAAALNAPLLTQIFDITLLACICFLFGMVETLPFSYSQRSYMIIMIELSVGFCIIKIILGKNKL